MREFDSTGGYKFLNVYDDYRKLCTGALEVLQLYSIFKGIKLSVCPQYFTIVQGYCGHNTYFNHRIAQLRPADSHVL